MEHHHVHDDEVGADAPAPAQEEMVIAAPVEVVGGGSTVAPSEARKMRKSKVKNSKSVN